MRVQPIARPSNPSVRFTELEEPTITRATNARKGRYARIQTGVLNNLSISKSGANALKKGTFSLVEYRRALTFIQYRRTTPTPTPVNICSPIFSRAVRPSD